MSGLGPVQGNVHFIQLGFWESSYGEKTPKSALTRFEGESYRLYQILEDQLKRQNARGSPWVALDRPTIADWAFFPWVRIASIGKLVSRSRSFQTQVSKSCHASDSLLAHIRTSPLIRPSRNGAPPLPKTRRSRRPLRLYLSKDALPVWR